MKELVKERNGFVHMGPLCILELLALRIDKGWSQAETARRLGVSYHTIRAWESGARQPRTIVRDCIRRFVGENSKV